MTAPSREDAVRAVAEALLAWDGCYVDVGDTKCSCSCHKENAPDLD